jgi:hypothetical protein
MGRWRRVRRRARIYLAVAVGSVFACVAGPEGTVLAATEPCPNAALRVGPSADLPDCRAYELVTPADKGGSQDMTFTNGTERAAVSASAEQVALETTSTFGPNPSLIGLRAVFSRNPVSGWQMKSVVRSGDSAHKSTMQLFSRDLSQVALKWYTQLNLGELSPDETLEAGPVGGPPALVESIPRSEGERTQFLGASSDFSHVLLDSVDHALLPPGAERIAAEGTDAGAQNLYDWTDGHLQLVNVRKEGALVSPCGAGLGEWQSSTLERDNYGTVNAVSQDGSKIFFISPQPYEASGSEPGCEEPARLYMRANGGEPVEVSAPEPGITLAPSEILPVRYNYATPDGSKVFFNTETALTSDDPSKANKLFEYDTEAPEGKRLKRIASGVPVSYGVGIKAGKGLFFSEDGSTVYVEPDTSGGVEAISRVETSTGKSSVVAASSPSRGASEPSYSTPNGEFFLFTSSRVEGEPRGAGLNEMYRYDHANGSVMCVTCGTGIAPAQGEVVEPEGALATQDSVPGLTLLSDNGQEVFFQTTARLVPQDTNSTFTQGDKSLGLDVYEWEADGTGGCELSRGCTHLLSSGEASGPSHFLGASRNGSDVLFATPARLAPQDTDGFDDIYDVRVDGGFAPPPLAPECLSCQGVGSPPPLFSPGASLTFAGAGNPVAPVVKAKPKPKKKPKPKHRTRHKGKSKAAGHHAGARRASRGGKRS